MKITKILFLVIFSIAAIGANAQGKVYSDYGYPAVESHDPITDRVQNNLFKKASFCGWFFPTEAVAAVGPTLTPYVNFLTTDSTSVTISDQGERNFNNWHVAGTCFDPKDENYLSVLSRHGEVLTKYNPFKVDSIYFTYLYVRKLDSTIINGTKVKVVDTLVFQFHNSGNLRFSTFGSAPVEKYGFPKDFVRSIGGSANATYTEKIPLDENDSTIVTDAGWRQKGMQVAIPASIAESPAADDLNQVAFNIFFKQMVPNAYGDTTESRNGDTIYNPVNYGGFALRVNENTSSQVPQDVYRSNAYFTTSRQLYGGTVNGWQNYIAGNAYFSARYMVAGFHLCTPNLSAKDVNAKGYGIGNLSPNPARAGQDVNVEFSIGNAEKVTLTVTNILGKTLQTIDAGKLASGHNVISFNTADLTPGVYFYTVSTPSFKASRKFTINN